MVTEAILEATWRLGRRVNRNRAVASLNALTGTVTANAVIARAGTNGVVNVFTVDATDLIIDING